MPIITGGNVISGGTIIPGSKVPVTYTTAIPTDALVGGGYYTPSNGALAVNVSTGYVYERQAGIWTRIDTL